MTVFMSSSEVVQYANKLSNRAFGTDVPTLRNDIKELKERITELKGGVGHRDQEIEELNKTLRRRNQEITDLKSSNSRLERYIAQIRQFINVPFS